jgi:hypothetical protein
MNIVRVYRTLLYLYPNGFRQQFSEEMVDVFRQKAHDLTTGGGVVFASFVLREFIGLPIGAAGAWIGALCQIKNTSYCRYQLFPNTFRNPRPRKPD